MGRVGRLVVAVALWAVLVLTAAPAGAQQGRGQAPPAPEDVILDPFQPLPDDIIFIEGQGPLPPEFLEGVPDDYRFLVDPTLPVPREFAFLVDPRVPVPPEYQFFFDPRLPVPDEFAWLFGPLPDAPPQQIIVESTAVPVEPTAPAVSEAVATDDVAEEDIADISTGSATDNSSETQPVVPATGPAEEASDDRAAPVVTIVPNPIGTGPDTLAQTAVPAPPTASGLPVPLLIFVAVATIALAATIPFFLRQRPGSEAALRELALTDDLTKLANRRRLDRDLATHDTAKSAIAIAMVDIDHFKRLNDDFGHATGDVVLQQVAELISRNVRADDVVYRYGGEEFCVLMPGTTELEAAAVVDRVRDVVAHHNFDQIDRAVTISIGVAATYENRTTGDETIRQADAALYAAKNSGRNRVVPSSFMS